MKYPKCKKTGKQCFLSYWGWETGGAGALAQDNCDDYEIDRRNGTPNKDGIPIMSDFCEWME